MSQIDAAGVGYKMGNELTHMDIKTAADLRRISQDNAEVWGAHRRVPVFGMQGSSQLPCHHVGLHLLVE